MVIAGCVGGGGLVGRGALVGGGAFVGGINCGVGDRKRVGNCKVGNCAVGKPPLSCVGNWGVIGSGVIPPGPAPKGVMVGGAEVAVTICGPPNVAVGKAVGVRCGAVPHRKNPAQ